MIILVLAAGVFFFLKGGAKKVPQSVTAPPAVSQESKIIPPTGNVDDAAKAFDAAADDELKASLDESKDQDQVSADSTEANDITGAVNENDF